jgi:WD40 repeat protein
VAALLGAVAVALIAGTCVSSYYARMASNRAEANRKLADEKSKLADSESAAKRQALDFNTQLQDSNSKLAQSEAEAKRNAEQAVNAKSEADRERQVAVYRGRDAEHALYLARMNLAQIAWSNGQMARVGELLEATRPAKNGLDSRGFEWYRLWHLCHQDRLTLAGDAGPVSAVALSPDKSTIAAAMLAGPIHLWDMATGRRKAILPGHERATRSAVFSPDGLLLATGGADGFVRLWDVANGEERLALPNHTIAASGISFSPTGDTLATGEFGPAVHIWRVSNGDLIHTLEGHRGYASSVAISPDGRFVAAGGEFEGAGQVKVWHLDDGQTADEASPKSKIPIPPQAPTGFLWGVVSCLAYSPDSRTLAVGLGQSIVTGASKQQITLYDSTTGEELATLSGHSGAITALAFAPEGQALVTASVDGTARKWQLESRETVATFRGHTGPILSLALSRDSQVLVSGSVDGMVKVWDMTPDRSIAWPWQRGYATAVAFAPDSARFATARQDGLIELWERGTAQKQLEFAGSGIVSTVAFSPDGKRLASGSLDQSLTLWDLQTRQQLVQLSGHTGEITSVAFAPDGLTLASTSADATVRFWDIQHREDRETTLPHPNAVTCLAFSADGKYFATTCGQPIYEFNKAAEIRLYNATTKQALMTFSDFDGAPTSVAFSRDSQILAAGIANPHSGTQTGRVILFDVPSGARRRDLTGFQGAVWCLRFSPDGKSLATGDNDKMIRLWDIKTGEERAVFSGHSLPVISLDFARDGGALVSASHLGDPAVFPTQPGGEVLIWDAVPSQVDEGGENIKP